MMNVLLIGSGGREHALAWKIAQSAMLSTLYAAPGNPGIGEHATLSDLDVDDHDAVISFCREKAIDLVVVGPEAPLVAGLADALNKAGIAVFGPRRRPRSWKARRASPRICATGTFPPAAYQRFNNAPKAKAYMRGRRARRSSSRPTGWPPARASPWP
jgi:phosphoribosylamine--glycine ligase